MNRMDRMQSHTEQTVNKRDSTEGSCKDAIGAQIVNHRALMMGREVGAQVGAGIQMSGCRGQKKVKGMKRKHMLGCTHIS